MKRQKLLSLIAVLLICMFVFSSCGMKKPSLSVVATKADDVAKITLVSHNGKGETKFGILNMGHSFLAIENISSKNIKIGKRNVVPGETITISVWSISEHFGVWYNVESNYIKNHNKYDGRISVTASINSTDISSMNRYIEKFDTWDPIHNCTRFSLNIWNIIAEESEKISEPMLHFPSYVFDMIKCFDKYSTNQNFNTSDTVGYYKGNEFKEYKFQEVLA